MSISVIIPTFNGLHKLPRLLNALFNQTLKPNEILVIIDGSTDNTFEVLSKLQINNPVIRLIPQENKGRAAVRNRGANEANGPLLIFFDDDMVPEHNCIQAHVLHHAERRDTILAGAQIDNCSDSDFQLYKSYLSKKWELPLLAKVGKPLEKDSLFLTAANFSVDKSTFWQLGGFDERLRDAEDFDLAIRAFESGIPVYYNNKALAYHHDEVTARSYIQRLRQYRKAHEYLRELEKARYASVKLHQPEAPNGLKAIFFRLFARRFWIHWIDKGLLQGWIPRALRYKLYDYIITANGVYFPKKVPLA